MVLIRQTAHNLCYLALLKQGLLALYHKREGFKQIGRQINSIGLLMQTNRLSKALETISFVASINRIEVIDSMFVVSCPPSPLRVCLQQLPSFNLLAS